jgi:hypothetical protein
MQMFNDDIYLPFSLLFILQMVSEFLYGSGSGFTFIYSSFLCDVSEHVGHGILTLNFWP